MVRKSFLIALLPILVGSAGGLAGDASGRQVLRDFLLSSVTLKQKIPVGNIVELSPYRAEVYAEEEGWGYAVVAFKGKSQEVLSQLCHASLGRKYLRPVIDDLKRQAAGELEIEESLKIYASHLRLKGVEQIGQRSENDWKLYGCRVRLADIRTVDPPASPTEVLASANYTIAKRSLGEKNYPLALASLKKTTLDLTVYRNAVAFIVPMVATDNAEMAAKIEAQYLEVDNISDTDALYFFGGYLVKSKRYGDAQQVFAKCLDLDRENNACRTSLEQARQLSEATERRESLDFDNLTGTGKDHEPP